ncbi:MAG: hypothetical protein IT372_24635 [Polyangiaceae bacterium]|nr:hypothetical protein [Polyangiaceae bacterium]
MSARDLTRRLSVRIVDALRNEGRILVVKGGAAALAREIEARMVGAIEAAIVGIQPRTHIDGEVTSTFGNEDIDEEIETLVEELTGALMDSDHVEDVFAEDPVIQRDIFRALRDGLLSGAAAIEGGEAEAEAGARGREPESVFTVRLDTLGYVASTVGKRAPAPVLRAALERVAHDVDGTLAGYDAEAREATFALRAGGPDARLELEEAVADELADLVRDGEIALPVAVRRVELGHAIPRSARAALRPRIDAAAARTLLRSGCAATWELEGDRTLKVTVTPLSEHDAIEVDHYVGLFARELATVLAGEPAREAEPAEAADEIEAPAKKAAAKKAAAKKAPAKKVAAEEPAPEEAPAKKAATKKAATKKAATKKAAAKKTSAKPR